MKMAKHCWMMTMKVCTGPPFSFCTAAADAAALRTTTMTMTMTIAAGGDANATSCWMRLCDDRPRGGGTRAFLFFTLCCEFGMVDADIVRPLRQHHDGCHGQQVVISPAFSIKRGRRCCTTREERKRRENEKEQQVQICVRPSTLPANFATSFPPVLLLSIFLPANFANSHVSP
jgi:hypothetical protein